jgi:hypothetical protein
MVIAPIARIGPVDFAIHLPLNSSIYRGRHIPHVVFPYPRARLESVNHLGILEG